MKESSSRAFLRRRAISRRGGFALVITVILLGLLLLVLVSTATLTNIETSIGFNSRREAQAQQNALFALNRAVGELQRRAGPDQRVTGSGAFDASAPGDGRRFWTGVWDTASPSSPLTWLISGNEEGTVNVDPSCTPTGFVNQLTPVTLPPLSGPTTKGALLVWEKTVGVSAPDYVVAPLVDLTGTSADGTPNVTFGRYAWWVGDEGVKARVNLVDARTRSGDPYLGTDPNTVGGAMRHQTAQRSGGESMSLFTALPVNDANLDRVIAENQLTGFAGVNPNHVESRFHDATATSIGVLSDVVSGGLKFDLTPFLLNGENATTNATRLLALTGTGAFHGRRINPLGADTTTFGILKSWSDLGIGNPGTATPRVYLPFNSGTNQMERTGILPVAVQYSVFFGVSKDLNSPPAAPTLRFHFMPLISIWNPYNRALNRVDLTFQIRFPAVLRFVSGGSQIGSFTLGGAFDPLTFVCPGSSWPSNSIGPGETWQLSVSNLEDNGGWTLYAVSENRLQPGWHPNNAFFVDNFSGPLPVAASQPVEIRQSGVFTPELTVRLGGTSGPVIQTLSSANYVAQDSPPVDVAIATSSSLNRPADVFYPEVNAHGWFLSPFSQGTAIARIGYSGARSIAEFAEWIPAGTDPTGFGGYSIWAPPEPPVWADVGGMKSGHNRCVLFEMPSEALPVFSIGDFQHVLARSESSWAPHYLFHDSNTLEAGLWDRFFLSAIPQNLSVVTAPLPSGRLSVSRRNGAFPALSALNYLGGASNPMETAAAYLAVNGAFNVNSISAEAWKGVLSGFKGVAVANVADPTGATEPATTNHPFSRFSYPELQALDTTSSDDATEAEAWAGYRRLTDSQLNNLADSVSNFVRANGPFLSLGAFATSAALTGSEGNFTNRVNPTSIAALPNAASLPAAADVPGRLTRSDILSVLGSVLTARSDTFRIRTYGETVNPATQQVEARAWCEAIVQRLPDYMVPDPEDEVDGNGTDGDVPWETPQNAVNQALGRRFVVVSFRWLSADDI